MKWYKRKRSWFLITSVLLLVVWMVCFYRVNNEYKIGAWKPYQIGDTYQVMGREVTWNSMQLLTREEAMEQFQMISKQDWLSWTEEEDDYCVVCVSVKNLTEEMINSGCTNWEVQCGPCANGASYLTSLANQHVAEGIKPGETEEIWVFYTVTPEDREIFQNHTVRIYTSLYPERIYLEGNL